MLHMSQTKNNEQAVYQNQETETCYKDESRGWVEEVGVDGGISERMKFQLHCDMDLRSTNELISHWFEYDLKIVSIWILYKVINESNQQLKACGQLDNQVLSSPAFKIGVLS